MTKRSCKTGSIWHHELTVELLCPACSWQWQLIFKHQVHPFLGGLASHPLPNGGHYAGTYYSGRTVPGFSRPDIR